jgi:hypothetical protein
VALTPAQVLSDELASIGLRPGATASQIKTALTAHYPGGLGTSATDPRTGLPYTTATAKDAGSGNLFGIIIGGGAFGYGLGALVDSALAGAGADAVIGGTDVAGAGAAADAGIGGGAVADVAGTGAGVGAAGAGVGAGAAALAGGAGIAAGIWSWLTTASNWVRIGEYVGGAILIYLAIKGLTGVDTPSISDAVKVAAVAPK